MAIVSPDEKKAASKAISGVAKAVELNVDTWRLNEMPNGDFERELDSLSNEIMREIGDLKKKYYEEGFREALKQVQSQQNSAAPVSTAVVASVSTDFDSRLAVAEQRLSDRLASLEQAFMNYQSQESGLKDMLNQHQELVSTLKSKLSEIAVLQSSIEEKLSQTPSSLGDKIDSLKGEMEILGNLVLEQDSKVNRTERARKASVRRLNRKFSSILKKLDDFKKVRKAIRKQGKRITTLQEVSVEKRVLKNALTRVRKTKAGRKVKRTAAKTAVVRSKTLVIKPKTAAKKKSAKARKTSAGKGRASKISISAQAPTTVEITQKK
ncbi:MAG: hypothetical protein V1717_04555 [Candidatus Micrarchaeota archaeon]